MSEKVPRNVGTLLERFVAIFDGEIRLRLESREMWNVAGETLKRYRDMPDEPKDAKEKARYDAQNASDKADAKSQEYKDTVDRRLARAGQKHRTRNGR